MPKPIRIEILGDDRDAKRAFSSVERGIGGLGRAAAVGGTAIAAGLAIGGAALFKIGETFEEVRGTITRGTGAVGDQLEAFVESAKDVLQTVPDTADVVAAALADVNTFFGISGKQLEETTELYLDFARLTGSEVATAIDKVDGVMTQFGETVADTDEVLGDLVRISQATGFEMEDLLTQAQTFGPIFANANFSLEETVAMLGQLKEAGVDVTRVGPALNQFFRRTAEAGEDPQRAFADIVTEIEEAENSTIALNAATDAFGTEGAQRMVSAIRSGAFSLEDLNELLGEGTGLVEEQTEATETFSDKWSEFKNRVLVGLEPIATSFLDALGKGLDRAAELFEPLQEKGREWLSWAEDNLVPVWETIRDAAVEAFEELIDWFIEWREQAEPQLELIENAFRRVWKFIRDSFRPALVELRRAWDEIGATFEELGTSRSEVLMNALTGIVLVLAGLVVVLGLIVGGTATVIGSFAAMAAAFVSAAKDIRDWIDRLIDSWNKFLDNLKKAVDIPILETLRLLPGFGGGTGGIPNPFENPVLFPQGGRSAPSSGGGGSRDFGGGTGGSRSFNTAGDITVNLNGSNLNPEQVAERVAWIRRYGDGY